MMRSGVARAGVVLALWAAVAASAPAADSRAVVEDLLTASGIRPKLTRAADQGRVALMAVGPSLGPRRFERLDRVSAEVFDAAALTRRAAEEFHAQYDPRLAPAALEGLRAPAIRVIIELQLVEPSRREVEAFARRAETEVGAARRALIGRVDDAAAASQTQLDLAVATLRGRTRAENADQPPARRLTPRQLDDRLRAWRQQLHDEAVQGIRLRLLHAAREVTDAELQEYVTFLESEPGVWLSRATRVVFERVLGASVERFQFEMRRAFSFQKPLVLD
jgi:hypothetical protein